MSSYNPIETRNQLEARIKLADLHGEGTPEGIALEFKAVQKREDQRELARDIAQFANKDGGTLIIGVAAPRDPATDLDTAKAVVPLKKGEAGKLMEWIAKAVSNYLYPAATQPPPLLLEAWGEGQVLVLNVPPSDTMVAVWRHSEAKNGLEFVYRTSNGKEWFTPEEAAMRLNNWSSRAIRIKIQSVLTGAEENAKKTQQPVLPVWVVLNPLPSQVTHSPSTQPRPRITPVGNAAVKVERPLDEDCFKICLVQGTVHSAPLTIPYHYVDYAWMNPNGRLVLDLNVTVLSRAGSWEVVRNADLPK